MGFQTLSQDVPSALRNASPFPQITSPHLSFCILGEDPCFFFSVFGNHRNVVFIFFPAHVDSSASHGTRSAAGPCISSSGKTEEALQAGVLEIPRRNFITPFPGTVACGSLDCSADVLHAHKCQRSSSKCLRQAHSVLMR